MAWIYSLSAECGPDHAAAIALAGHFTGETWRLGSGKAVECVTRVFQDAETAWWCMVFPSAEQPEESRPSGSLESSELGLLFLERLRSAPPFRFALVGTEVDEFRTYGELVTPEGLDLAVPGLVLSSEIWSEVGRPERFLAFSDTHFWLPYLGEGGGSAQSN